MFASKDLETWYDFLVDAINLKEADFSLAGFRDTSLKRLREYLVNEGVEEEYPQYFNWVVKDAENLNAELKIKVKNMGNVATAQIKQSHVAGDKFNGPDNYIRVLGIKDCFKEDKTEITADLTEHLNENSNIKTWLRVYLNQRQQPSFFSSFVQKDDDFANKKCVKADSYEIE